MALRSLARGRVIIGPGKRGGSSAWERDGRTLCDPRSLVEVAAYSIEMQGGGEIKLTVKSR